MSQHIRCVYYGTGVIVGTDVGGISVGTGVGAPRVMVFVDESALIVHEHISVPVATLPPVYRPTVAPFSRAV